MTNTENTPDSIVFSISAAKIVDNRVAGLRYVRRGGLLVLQTAHAWERGSERGVQWRDVPVVDEEEPA